MIKRTFIVGLTAIIPLGITIFVIGGLFRFADGISGKFLNKFLYKYIGYEVVGLNILVAILIIFIVGIFIRFTRMKLVKWMEDFFFRIPLVNKIYPPIKRIVDFLFFPRQKSFKSAVLVEYPRKGIYSLGFVTNDNYLKFKERQDRKLYNIFIPSSPSPLTGFMIIVEEKDLIFLDIGVDNAIQLLVSGGLLNPQ